MPSFIKEMQDHIAQLTKERDQARREACENLVNSFRISLGQDHLDNMKKSLDFNFRLATENQNDSYRAEARRRGWDCYNETV